MESSTSIKVDDNPNSDDIPIQTSKLDTNKNKVIKKEENIISNFPQ